MAAPSHSADGGESAPWTRLNRAARRPRFRPPQARRRAGRRLDGWHRHEGPGAVVVGNCGGCLVDRRRHVRRRPVPGFADDAAGGQRPSDFPGQLQRACRSAGTSKIRASGRFGEHLAAARKQMRRSRLQGRGPRSPVASPGVIAQLAAAGAEVDFDAENAAGASS